MKTLRLAKELIAIESVEGNRKALNEALALALSELRGFSIEHFESNGYKSALVHTGKQRPKRFKVILNGHLDVIPGKASQYRPVVKDGRLYGAGAMDMKSSVACLIGVFKEVAGAVDYPLGLQLVTEEEIGGFDGTKYQIEQGVRADFVVAGESTALGIENEAKGILWLRVAAPGVTAHSAYPWNGANAIVAMNGFLSKLQRRFPRPNKAAWVSTLNVARIETGNTAFNKIPDDCTVSLDIRFVPSESKTILSEVKKLVPRGFMIEVIAHEPAHFTDKEDTYLKKLAKTIKASTGKQPRIYGAQGSSDARHYTAAKCVSVEFGPVGGGIGTDDEWVDIKSLETYQEILKHFLQDL